MPRNDWSSAFQQALPQGAAIGAEAWQRAQAEKAKREEQARKDLLDRLQRLALNQLPEFKQNPDLVSANLAGGDVNTLLGISGDRAQKAKSDQEKAAKIKGISQSEGMSPQEVASLAEAGYSAEDIHKQNVERSQKAFGGIAAQADAENTYGPMIGASPSEVKQLRAYIQGGDKPSEAVTKVLNDRQQSRSTQQSELFNQNKVIDWKKGTDIAGAQAIRRSPEAQAARWQRAFKEAAGIPADPGTTDDNVMTTRSFLNMDDNQRVNVLSKYNQILQGEDKEDAYAIDKKYPPAQAGGQQTSDPWKVQTDSLKQGNEDFERRLQELEKKRGLR